MKKNLNFAKMQSTIEPKKWIFSSTTICRFGDKNKQHYCYQFIINIIITHFSAKVAKIWVKNPENVIKNKKTLQSLIFIKNKEIIEKNLSEVLGVCYLQKLYEMVLKILFSVNLNGKTLNF